MHIFIMTLFPDMVQSVLSESIVGRAIAAKKVTVDVYNIRDYTDDKHGKVDDYPYGGGAGMVMKAQPIYACYEAICRAIRQESAASEAPLERLNPEVTYMSPQGRPFSQDIAKELSKKDYLILLCGHYEGIDERVVEEIVADEISVGDYVLTGGELPALTITDAVVRLLPGVLHNDTSAASDSFEDGLLEYPQYTRPEVWNERSVPSILLSGDHAKVDAWRAEQSLLRTKQKRPDLLA